jgi:hypothetical protein
MASWARASSVASSICSTALIDQTDPALAPEPPPLYAATCRGTKKDNTWLLEMWNHPLPTMPLWLADSLAVPLELEASYEDTCRILRIP